MKGDHKFWHVFHQELEFYVCSSGTWVDSATAWPVEYGGRFLVLVSESRQLPLTVSWKTCSWYPKQPGKKYDFSAPCEETLSCMENGRSPTEPILQPCHPGTSMGLSRTTQKWVPQPQPSPANTMWLRDEPPSWALPEFFPRRKIRWFLKPPSLGIVSYTATGNWHTQLWIMEWTNHFGVIITILFSSSPVLHGLMLKFYGKQCNPEKFVFIITLY